MCAMGGRDPRDAAKSPTRYIDSPPAKTANSAEMEKNVG